MKTILITIALLIGLSVQGQVYLESMYSEEPNGNMISEHYYEYDNNWKLTFMTAYYGDEGPVDHIYKNDTLIRIDDEYYVFYDGDTVTEVYASQTIATSYLDEYGNPYETIYMDGTYERYVWDEYNNLTERTRNDGYTEQYSPSTTILNPFYQSMKSLKKTHGSSVNWTDSYYSLDGTEYLNEVISMTHSYPTKVNFYVDGVLEFIHHYTYYYVSDTPEIPIQPHTVLQKDYYDMMGRKIPKPVQGFYIECKTTDKGVISTKYFTQ